MIALRDLAGTITSVAAAVVVTWTGMTYALDDRYVDEGELGDAVRAIKVDRAEADLREARSRLKVVTVQQSYAEGEWVQRRAEERALIEQEVEDLERELEAAKDDGR